MNEMKREVSISELIYFARMGNQNAYEELLNRFNKKIYYFVKGKLLEFGYKSRLNDEIQDFIQIAKMMFIECIYYYNESKSDFYNYACVCMKSSILNDIRKKLTKKGLIGLDALSLDNQVMDGEDMYYVDLAVNNQPSFEGIYCMDEFNPKYMYDKIKDDIGEDYAEIYNLKIQGYKNREIGEKLKIKEKKVCDCYKNIRKFYNGTLTKK